MRAIHELKTNEARSCEASDLHPILAVTASSVVFITARIDPIFVSSTAVHRNDFHMFPAVVNGFYPFIKTMEQRKNMTLLRGFETQVAHYLIIN